MVSISQHEQLANKMPGFLWILIFLLAYIVIKSPSVGVWLIGLPARLISGIGNFIIGVAHSYGAP
jgi:hypothetical protein